MSSLALAGTALRIAPQFFERLSADLKRTVSPAPFQPDYRNWSQVGLRAAWIGHSTVVVRMDDFTFITDPVFSSRVGLNLGPFTLGLKRLVEPAGDVRGVPRPDLILLSHAHMDHFDLPTLKKLQNKETTIVTAVNTSDLLQTSRYEAVRELRWNEAIQVGRATVRAFEVRHWGARMRNDTHRGYTGYLVEAGRYRVLFGGDTALVDTFRDLRAFGPIDLAIMPIGAYNPWIYAHCTPEQALRMADDAGAEFVLPVHHKTFELSREPLEEPLHRLLNAAGSSGNRIAVREIGQEFHQV